MSQENVEIIRAAFDAYARGDTSGVLTDVAPDVIIQRWAPLPDPAIYRGPEGLLRMIADWIEDFDEFETGVEEYIDASSDQVITRVRQKARGAASGVPIEAEFWFLWTLRKGRVVRWDIYMSREAALEAAGLSE